MIDRFIGSYAGKAPGALVVALGALHGNEHAGVEGLQIVLDLLQRAGRARPDFVFHGKFVALRGNRAAYEAGQRFIDKDLNRIWTPAHLARIGQIADTAALSSEDREMTELKSVLQTEVLATRPEALVLLDLHTTSAGGGIFSIPSDDRASLRLAKALHVPVILGLFEGIEGSLLSYAASNHLTIDGYPGHTIGVAFEAGQHDDPRSVSHCVAATLNTLHAAGCIDEAILADTGHDALLRSYASPLPTVTRLRYIHALQPGDDFRMRPGYVNFQPIVAGEHLADDQDGPIRAPFTGRILMPLYQPQGSDGFFIVEDTD